MSVNDLNPVAPFLATSLAAGVLNLNFFVEENMTKKHGSTIRIGTPNASTQHDAYYNEPQGRTWLAGQAAGLYMRLLAGSVALDRILPSRIDLERFGVQMKTAEDALELWPAPRAFKGPDGFSLSWCVYYESEKSFRVTRPTWEEAKQALVVMVSNEAVMWALVMDLCLSTGGDPLGAVIRSCIAQAERGHVEHFKVPARASARHEAAEPPPPASCVCQDGIFKPTASTEFV